MSPDQVIGHVEAMRAVIRHLRDRSGLQGWDNPECERRFWLEMNGADECLKDAIEAIAPAHDSPGGK